MDPISEGVFLEEFVGLVMHIISLFDPNRGGISRIGRCFSWISRSYERNGRYGIIQCVRDNKSEDSMLVIPDIRENRYGVGVELDVYLLDGLVGRQAKNWIGVRVR